MKRLPSDYAKRPEERAWIWFALALIVVAEAALILFSVLQTDLTLLLYSNLLAIASIAVGGFLGFLFGIPRSLSGFTAAQNAEDNPSDDSPDRTKGAYYRANTNLEQISDWLTKILVGVGLTQLNALPTLIDRLGTYLSSGLQHAAFTPPIAAIICIGFCLVGFILVYLWTRIYLGSQFAQADLSMFGRQIDDRFDQLSKDIDKELEDVSSRLERQDTRDATALNMVERWLISGEDYGYSSEVVSEAVLLASPPVQTQIFYKARGARRTHIPPEQVDEISVRTIPIFEALVKGGPKDLLHQYHGQLGYALQDTPNAGEEDFERAISELSQAIEVRDKAHIRGHQTYELVRAVNKIRRDENFRNGRASDATAKNEVLSDLKVAMGAVPDFADNPQVIKWLELNNVTDLNDNEVQ